MRLFEEIGGKVQERKMGGRKQKSTFRAFASRAKKENRDNREKMLKENQNKLRQKHRKDLRKVK